MREMNPDDVTNIPSATLCELQAKQRRRKKKRKTDLLFAALGSDDLAENKQPASFCFTRQCVHFSPPTVLYSPPPGVREGKEVKREGV